MSGTDRGDTPGKRAIRGATAGLIAGIVASFAMEVAQAVLAKLSSSDEGSGEPPATVQAADRVTTAIADRPVPEDSQPFAGEIVHYVVGAGLGIAYGIAAEFDPRVTAGHGTGFALATAVVLDEAVVPAAGLGDAPWNTPASTHLYSLASHLVFGLVAEATRRQVGAAMQPH